MRSVLRTAASCVTGAVETVTEAGGIVFHRTTARARRQLSDFVFDFMSAIPSGVRLRARTDATTIELDVRLTHPVLDEAAYTGSTFDLVVGDQLRDPVTTTEETLLLIDPTTATMQTRPAGVATLVFPLAGTAGMRDIEIWFPAGAKLTLVDVRISDGAAFQPAPLTEPLWIHYGSSISQCSEADRPTGTWPVIVARQSGRPLLNLAYGGQCHLDQFAARAIRDTPAAAISLELGINVINGDSLRERTFVSALHGFLDTVRDGHPGTPILVVTPIICPVVEDHPGPTLVGDDRRVHVVDRPADLGPGALTLRRVRELLHHHVALRRADGDGNLHVLDGLTLFGADDVGDLPDGLHPNAGGYRRIAERFGRSAFGPDGVLPRSVSLSG